MFFNICYSREHMLQGNITWGHWVYEYHGSRNGPAPPLVRGVHFTLLYSTLLYSTLLYNTILHYTLLYYTILHYDLLD